MRVALVILHDDPARGGAERYTSLLAESLSSRGHEVSLVSTAMSAKMPKGADTIDVATQGGVSKVRLDAWGLTRTLRFSRFLRSLDSHLAMFGYDVVHAMLPVRRCDVYHPHAGIAADAAEQTGWRLAFNPRRAAFAKVERQLLDSPDPPVVLSLSRYIQSTLERQYPNLPERSRFVLPNGVDLNWFSPVQDSSAAAEVVGLAPGGPVLLMVAQDFERKGLKEAIVALAGSRHADARLVVVGRPDPAAYRRLAAERGVGGRVIFAGAQSDPRRYYHAADAFILPTRHDPCSLVVLESLACGVPVISTAFNGACELMQNGVHGEILSDPSNVRALTAAIDAVLEPAALSTMRSACRALRPAISQSHHLDLLESLYRRIVESR